MSCSVLQLCCRGNSAYVCSYGSMQDPKHGLTPSLHMPCTCHVTAQSAHTYSKSMHYMHSRCKVAHLKRGQLS
jgi:hypothetical protein